MAKNLKKLISMIVALAMCFTFIATPAAARNNNESSTSTEWYQVIVNGKTAASASGKAGDHTWLVQGVYSWEVSVKGTTMHWRAGKHSGTVNLANYISIPDGYEIAEDGYTVEHKSVTGTNSQSANFDNAIITVNVKALHNPTTGEEIEVTEPSEPSEPTEPSEPSEPTEPSEPSEPTEPSEPSEPTEPSEPSKPTEPIPVETSVTVNHIYRTFDAYTGETVLDGRTSSTEAAIEGDSYTAVAVPTYNGNAYEQQTADAALTITIVADASANVINIEYLRTIDTTPVDYEPILTVTKIANQKGYKAGDTVTWTITVKNISADAAYNVVVTDDLTGESWTLETLAPGASVSFTATLENVSAGTLKNVAEVTWTDNDEIPDDEEDEPKTDEDEEIVEVRELINYNPVLSVVKTADKAVYEAGETITWTITVKNVSEFTAHDVTIVDELTGDSWSIEALEPGAEQTFTTSLANAAPGSVKNVVVVTWNDNDEIPDEEETHEVKTTSDEELVAINDPIPENYTPVLTVTKVADKETYEVGETITWTITVMNVGQHTAYDVVIVDEQTGDEWFIEELAAGKQKSFTTSLENAEIGTVKNVVVTSWTDNDEIPDEEEDEIKTTSDEEIVTVEAPPNPAPVLRIVKTSSKYLFSTGETVTWYISVENISDYTAYDVVLTDELTNDRWVIGTLEPGAARSFATTTKTTEAGSITNTAFVTWTDGDETPDAEETNEIKYSSDDARVIVEDPAPEEVVPVPQNNNGDIIIEDEDVPLAAAPKTGDISGVLEIVSMVSLGGLFLLKRKKEEE